MGKVDDNKRKKRERLLNKAYELFTTKGFTNTSISDIVENADVAKGTFYLYFKDKYDLKDKLVEYKTQELFLVANTNLAENNIHGLEEQLIFIIDFIVDKLRNDKGLLRLISKNLIMGALRQTLISTEKRDNEVYNNFLKLVENDEYEYNDIDVLLFTVVELAGSTCFNSIIYNEPLPLDEYKPYLYRTVRLIINSYRIK